MHHGRCKNFADSAGLVGLQRNGALIVYNKCTLIGNHNPPSSAPLHNSDKPGQPEEVTVMEIQGTPGEMKNSCVFLLQLNPPSNINADDVNHYIIDYQSNQPVTTDDTSKTFAVSNCSRDLRVRVTAVNRCGASGNSTSDIVPRFMAQVGSVDVPYQTGVPSMFTL